MSLCLWEQAQTRGRQGRAARQQPPFVCATLHLSACAGLHPERMCEGRHAERVSTGLHAECVSTGYVVSPPLFFISRNLSPGRLSSCWEAALTGPRLPVPDSQPHLLAGDLGLSGRMCLWGSSCASSLASPHTTIPVWRLRHRGQLKACVSPFLGFSADSSSVYFLSQAGCKECPSPLGLIYQPVISIS